MLALSEEPFMLDQGVRQDMLSMGLRQLAADGCLDIVFVENTGPYRKLLPALRCHAGEERLIVTVDDDMIYPPHWLAGLVETYRRRRCVVAYRCRAMAIAAGSFLPYSKWRLLPSEPDAFGEAPPEHHALFTLATGVRGILYDARFLADLDLLDELRALAPGQDDLAFKAATMCAGIGTVLVDDDLSCHRFGPRLAGPDSESETLFHQNKKRNDAAWGRLTQHLERRGLFRLAETLAN